MSWMEQIDFDDLLNPSQNDQPDVNLFDTSLLDFDDENEILVDPNTNMEMLIEETSNDNHEERVENLQENNNSIDNNNNTTTSNERSLFLKDGEVVPKTDETIFKCPYCPYMDQTFYSFIVHIKAHESEKLFKCEYCFETFKKFNALCKHKTDDHPGSTCTFFCQFCPITFQKNSDVTCHVEKTHPTECLKCILCKRYFPNSYAILCHYKLHVGGYLYKCYACEYATNVLWQYKRHLSKHSFKTFICKICATSFGQEQPLIKHMKSHYQSENDGKTDSEVSCKY